MLNSLLLYPPRQLIEKLLPTSDNVVVTLYDKFGHSHTGTVLSVSAEQGLIGLQSGGKKGKDMSLSVLALNDIVSFMLHQAEAHLEHLTGTKASGQATANTPYGFDFDDYLLTQQTMLKTNYGLTLELSLDQADIEDEATETRVKNLVDKLVDLIAKTCQDEFGLQMVTTLSTIHIVNNDAQLISVKRAESALRVQYDYRASSGTQAQLDDKLKVLFERVL
ncbi:hypothetical protein [Saccharospirillum alexandrii]|uniref:hypothetical protein n=1 Tax=Saccharospirillum alexandrii TaxID=2448477 RepID=UPI000FD95691|nr:hypothetical protein [Saccharospirillum alexandrii]